MSIRIRLIVAAAVSLVVAVGAAPHAHQDLVARARAIHDRIITLDTHDDIDPRNFTADCNYTMRLTTQVNLPKMKEGGLDVSFLIVDHIDYAVKMIGIDHVGIASDFDGGGGIDGWNSSAETFNVTLELVRRGYTEGQIAKIWSGNLLRVWGEVESVAKSMQSGRRR